MSLMCTMILLLPTAHAGRSRSNKTGNRSYSTPVTQIPYYGPKKHEKIGKSPCSLHQPSEQAAKRWMPSFLTKDQASAVLIISLTMPFWDRNGGKLENAAIKFCALPLEYKKVWLDKSVYYRGRLSSLKSLFFLHSEFVWAKWTQMTRQNQ